jgi:hypothetical protein
MSEEKPLEEKTEEKKVFEKKEKEEIPIDPETYFFI